MKQILSHWHQTLSKSTVTKSAVMVKQHAEVLLADCFPKKHELLKISTRHSWYLLFKVVAKVLKQ